MSAAGDDSKASVLAVVAQVASQLTDRTSDAEACEILSRAAGALESEAAFLTVIKDGDGVEIHRMVLACDPEWYLEYEARGAYADDPWLAHARRSSETRPIPEISADTPRQREIVALAKRFGFSSGVVVPVHGPRGLSRFGVLYLADRRDTVGSDRSASWMEFAAGGLALQFNRWQLARLRADLIATAQITAADIQLLAYEREGRSTKEVARLVDATGQSIDSRWKRLRARLHVSSRTHAALLAAEYGLI